MMYSEYIEEGEEYSMDGDVIDNRNRIIKHLRAEIKAIYGREDAEYEVRDKNPAVMAAWEQYQIVLKLSAGDE